MVCALNHVFCRFMSLPASHRLTVTTLADVANYLLNNILVCMIRILFACRSSRCHFIPLCDRVIFCFVRYLVTATLDYGGWRMRYAVSRNCIWYAVLFYGYGSGSYFYNLIHSDRSFLESFLSAARQGLSDGFWRCRQRWFIEEEIATILKRRSLAHRSIVVGLVSWLALTHVRVDFGSDRCKTSFDLTTHLLRIWCC